MRVIMAPQPGHWTSRHSGSTGTIRWQVGQSTRVSASSIGGLRFPHVGAGQTVSGRDRDPGAPYNERRSGRPQLMQVSRSGRFVVPQFRADLGTLLDLVRVGGRHASLDAVEGRGRPPTPHHDDDDEQDDEQQDEERDRVDGREPRSGDGRRRHVDRRKHARVLRAEDVGDDDRDVVAPRRGVVVRHVRAVPDRAVAEPPGDVERAAGAPHRVRLEGDGLAHERGAGRVRHRVDEGHDRGRHLGARSPAVRVGDRDLRGVGSRRAERVRRRSGVRDRAVAERPGVVRKDPRAVRGKGRER